MICPNCDGIGYNFPLIVRPGIDPEVFRCRICEGKYFMPENIEYDPERGKALKKERTDMPLSLRSYCIAFKVDAQTRSEQERGFFRRG